MIRYRRLQIEDLETRVDWMNNSKIYNTMHYQLPITIENTIKWFENNRDNESRRDFVLEEDGIPMVMNGLTGLDPKILKAESYTIVNPNVHGKGFGKMSLSLKLGYAFDVWKINKVFAYVDSDNIASLKMCEKIGCKFEGILRKEVFRETSLIDRIYMGFMPEDFNRDFYNECLSKCETNY